MNLIENVKILESEKKIVGEQCYQNYAIKNNYTEINLKNEFIEKIKTIKEKQIDSANNAYALGISSLIALFTMKIMGENFIIFLSSLVLSYFVILFFSSIYLSNVEKKLNKIHDKLNLDVCKNEKIADLLKTEKLKKEQESNLKIKINKILKEENIDKNYEEIKNDIYLSSKEKIFNGKVVNEIIDATINILKSKKSLEIV